ncbi:MAG: serine hydrolase [Candidatus Bathyarchaeota archaeon]|nr:serine hydrolase [Candidatus Bathyarchaeota archaeon]
MNKKNIGAIAVILIIVIATGTYYGALMHRQLDYGSELETLLDTKFNEYCENKQGLEEGNIAMKISSPKGDYFVSVGSDQTITENTHYRIASVTKTFTAAAILLLNQEGLLQIDDKITDVIPNKDITYIPETTDYNIPYKEEITIKQLIGHTAGVFDVTNSPIPENTSAPYSGMIYIDYIKELEPEHTFSFDELVGVVASNQLSYFRPGTSYHYSNTGYSMLATIIERVSGLSYAEFIEQYLLEPNGLSDTTIPVSGTDKTLPSPYAEGYAWIDREMLEVTLDNMSPHVAEGNIISTLNNINKWISLLYSGEAGLNKDTIEIMTTPLTEENQGYGLGTTIVEGLGYGHNGAHLGYLNIAMTDPETGVTVTIFAPIDFDNLGDEINYLYNLGREAKRTLGYN